MTVSDQCIKCAHYQGFLTCAAYPYGIPEEILTGLHDHNLHYPGDDAETGEHIHFKLLKV